MSYALSSRERTNHGRRHCAKRATLPARLVADCTSDASASASDENSAALELHEPMVPLARERPPGCARTTAGAGCCPVVNRAELAVFGPSMRAELWPQSPAHRQTRNGRNFSIGQAVSRHLSPIRRGSARSNRRRYAARNTTVAGTAIRPSGGSPGLGRRRYIAPPVSPGGTKRTVQCHPKDAIS